MTPAPRAVRPLGRVLGAEEAGLYRDAAAAVAAMRTAARAQREAAAASLADECRVAREAAEQEGRRAAARLLAQTASRAQGEIARLPGQIAVVVAEAVARVVGGLDLAEAVARAARRAVEDLRGRHGIVVRVAPACAAAVRARLSGLAEDLLVVEDRALQADDCVIETGAGSVRAGLSQQLAVLRDALDRAAAGNAPGSMAGDMASDVAGGAR